MTVGLEELPSDHPFAAVTGEVDVSPQRPRLQAGDLAALAPPALVGAGG